MKPADAAAEIRRWFGHDGAVLVAVQWLTEDGRREGTPTDEVAVAFRVSADKIGWISASDWKPHATEIAGIKQDLDDLVFLPPHRRYRIVVSPLWLQEQRERSRELRASGPALEGLLEELEGFVPDAL